MTVEEKLQRRRLHKITIFFLKVIPMLLALCELSNSVLSFFGIKAEVLSFIGGISLLPLLFLYFSSYVFGFCSYHRMFLHYILVTNGINIYDMYVGIPISELWYLVLHCVIAGITLFLVLFLYRRSRCCNK